MICLVHERARVRTGSFGQFRELLRKARREATLIGVAALILLFLTGFSFWLTQRVLSDTETADELNGYNAKLTKFVQLLRTVESSQRGYLITGEQDFLEPYEKMTGLLMPMAHELQDAAPKTLNVKDKAAALLDPLAAKLEEMRKTIALAKAEPVMPRSRLSRMALDEN